MQSELDDMRASAKKCFRHSRPGACTYCGKYIKCDMYRHVSNYHLDLGQLWCMVLKGMAQDCMDHVRGAHGVPPDVKSTSLDRFFPPWTVWRQIWADALRPCHSGISTDVLLFSEIHFSLVHHYRVFRRGLPHFAFRWDYLECLRIFVSQSSAFQHCTKCLLWLRAARDLRETLAPGMGRPGLRRKHGGYRDESVRRGFGRSRCVNSRRGLAGALVYDCRPPLLP